jgi:hypothetical protein
MNYQRLLIAAIGLSVTQISWAQSNTKDDVRFFEHFFDDAAVVKSMHVEAVGIYADFDAASVFILGAQGGMPINAQLDVGARWSFNSFDFDNGGSESGISDIDLWGRYQLKSQSKANITVGGTLTLPIGDEDIGGDRLNFGGFAAARMPLNNGMVVMGSVGLNFVEVGGFDGDDRELSIHLGGGAIYQLNRQTHVTGEVGIDTEEDYFALTGGIDHAISSAARVRAALVVGLDDGAPDFALQGGFLLNF